MFRTVMSCYLGLVVCNCTGHRPVRFPNANVVSSDVLSVCGFMAFGCACRTILGRKLNNNRRASIGVVLYYAKNRADTFILLGRERADKCDGGTWSELGGSVQIGEIFLEAAIREVEEESGGVYQLKASDVLNNGMVCYREYKQNDERIREEVYILLQVGDYHPADLLCKAVNHQNKDAYREKDAFKWVACASLWLVKENPCILQDIDGKDSKFTLRRFFYEALQRERFRVSLRSVMK